MAKLIFLTFLSFIFFSSLKAQNGPYKRDAGLTGVFVVENKSGERLYVDQNGKNIFGDKTFHIALAFGCGYAPVQMNGADQKEWIYIDKTGTEVLKFTSVGEADSFKGPDCKATLWNVDSSKYKDQGCGTAAFCDCALYDVKKENNSAGKSHFLYKMACAPKKI